MAKIHYKGTSYESRPDETLLKMFLRRGVKVPYSCGGGTCHFCMHRCTEGDIPPQAQSTLRPVYQENRFFLLCCCVPTSDMHIELPPRTERFCQMEIDTVTQSADKTLLTLLPFSQLNTKTGQYLSLLAGKNIRLVAEVIQGSLEGEPIQVALATSKIPPELKLDQGIDLEAQGPFNTEPPSMDMEAGIRRRFPDPDPDLWQALDNGTLLPGILKVFYHRVFRDPQLAPYFEGVTESRLVEKQYNFLHQAISGEKVYFGERPRNSHHWMVVSDELFDHRADILRTVLEEFSLPEPIIEKVLDIEELYRQDIVKEKPWNKVVFGIQLPVEGYETMEIDEASLCDGCESEVQRGERITYHVRTGKVYCQRCREQ